MTPPSILEFYTAEANAIHKALDTAGTPREYDDMPLTMSQRVETLVIAYRALVLTKQVLKRAGA